MINKTSVLNNNEVGKEKTNTNKLGIRRQLLKTGQASIQFRNKDIISFSLKRRLPVNFNVG